MFFSVQVYTLRSKKNHQVKYPHYVKRILAIYSMNKAGCIIVDVDTESAAYTETARSFSRWLHPSPGSFCHYVGYVPCDAGNVTFLQGSRADGGMLRKGDCHFYFTVLTLRENPRQSNPPITTIVIPNGLHQPRLALPHAWLRSAHLRGT